MLETLSLDGQVTIVTGGGTGLGRAMVMALARAGSDIVIAARRKEPMEEVAGLVRDIGRRALVIPTDVTDSGQVRTMVLTAIKEFERIDVLINNAALLGAPRTPIWEMTDEEWRYGIDANLTGAFYCSRAVARHMADRRRGKIINVSSGFGVRGGRDMYTYTCGKGAIFQLTRTLGLSLAKYGITSNTIAPGFIPTRETERTTGMPLRSAEFTPIGEFPKPIDIGPVAVFLASAASNYMSGESIFIDGGGLAGGFAPTNYSPEF